jgi:hypothetical protein
MSEKIITLIFGKRGSGKSFLGKKLIAGHKRYLVYDTLGEYIDGVVIESFDVLKLFWGSTYVKDFRIIYRPLDPEREFEKICDLVWNLGNMTFLIEEVDCFCKPQSICMPFGSIIQRGRHRNITLIGVTQRPHGIARLLTSQAKQMCIFNTTEPRDVDYFRQVVGDCLVERVTALKQYEYIEWLDGREELVVKKE